QDQTLRIDAALNQRFGYRSGAGPELDHRSAGFRIDALSHAARQRLAGWHHRAGAQRPFEPGSEKLHLVVETKRLLDDAGDWMGMHCSWAPGPGKPARYCH